MEAHKSTDSYTYFLSEWVNNVAVWEVKDKKFIVKAKVSAKVANINIMFIGVVDFRVTVVSVRGHYVINLFNKTFG